MKHVVRRQVGRSSVVKLPTKTRSKPKAAPHVDRWNTEAAQQQREQLEAAVAAEDLTKRPLIAVLVPVLRRPQRVQPLLDSFRSATDRNDAKIYFIAQTSDSEEVAAIRAVDIEPILVADGHRSWAKKINIGYRSTDEPWLLLAADDVAFHSGWVDVIRPLLLSHHGVLGSNDLGNKATIHGLHSTHPLVRRAYADHCGTVDERGKVLHEGYDHNFPDTELVATAKKRGLYLHRQDFIIEHMHPVWGKGQTDPVYKLGAQNFARDQALFLNRSKRFGFS